MQNCSIDGYDFHHGHEHSERRVYLVLALTIITMFIEILAGFIFNSMALTADGWHMGTHAAAFGITIFAYRYARRDDSEHDGFQVHAWRRRGYSVRGGGRCCR